MDRIWSINGGTTPIAVGDADGSTVHATFTNNAGASTGASVGQILDSPPTTAATTYKLQVRHENGSGNININRINQQTIVLAGRYSSTIINGVFSIMSELRTNRIVPRDGLPLEVVVVSYKSHTNTRHI